MKLDILTILTISYHSSSDCKE